MVAFSAGIVQSRASGSLREYARVLPSWLLTVRLRLSSAIEFPCDVMSCAAMSGRIRFVLLYTFALIVIDPEFTRAAADEMVVLPFGYIATVGTCLICRAFAGTDFSGIDVSSAQLDLIHLKEEGRQVTAIIAEAMIEGSVNVSIPLY